VWNNIVEDNFMEEEYTPTFDHMQPSPPHMDSYSSGVYAFVPLIASGGTSSSRGSKRKALVFDLDI